MQCQINKYDGIGSFYTCETCTEIMKDHHYGELDDIYEEGFVHGGLDNGQTPEQLLEKLKTIKQTKFLTKD